MLTSEVRKWIKKVECGQYSYEDAMFELSSFLPYLTREEVNQLKDILKKSNKS